MPRFSSGNASHDYYLQDIVFRHDYYRPQEGGRLYDMKVVSGSAFLRTYYVLKKLTANHAAAISHKH